MAAITTVEQWLWSTVLSLTFVKRDVEIMMMILVRVADFVTLCMSGLFPNV